MPLYEYQCDACHHRFERIQKFSDPPVDVCPHCGKGPVRKLLSSPAIQFKGSGWYVTDYAKKSSAPTDTKTKDSKDGTPAGATSGDSSSAAESSASAAKPTQASTAADKKS
jgi:putative FmdB family regulatory protein